MSSRAARVGVCTDNRGYPSSLEVGKLYPLIPDAEAAKHGYLRVIDESGEDYAYSAGRFFLLQVPKALAKVLSARRHTRVPRPKRVLRRTGVARRQLSP